MKSKLKNLVFFCLIVFIISADKAADKILISEVSFLEGMYKHNDRPITGEIIDYYENDVLKFTYAALDGRLHGEAKEFYTDGSIRSVRNYTLNKLYGDYIEYFENGDVKVQFKVGLNAYGQGEKLNEIEIAKGKKNKLKGYEQGVLIFFNQEKGNLKTSEEISILEQSNFRILDEKNQVLFER